VLQHLICVSASILHKQSIAINDNLDHLRHLVLQPYFQQAYLYKFLLGGIDENLMWWTTLAKPQ
jgi:hypothetical protein